MQSFRRLHFSDPAISYPSSFGPALKLDASITETEVKGCELSKRPDIAFKLDKSLGEAEVEGYHRYLQQKTSKIDEVPCVFFLPPLWIVKELLVVYTQC